MVKLVITIAQRKRRRRKDNPRHSVRHDVAGYSRLAGAEEEGTHQRVQAHLRELIDPKIAEHRGRIVKNTGTASWPSSERGRRGSARGRGSIGTG